MLARVLHAGQHHASRTVAGCADFEQAQGVRHHVRGQYFFHRELLLVARVGIVETVAGVLDLDLCEVLFGGPVNVHPPSRVQGEVGGVRAAHQTKAQPVGVVPALAGVWGEKALGCRVCTDHQGHVAHACEDTSAGGVDPGCAGSTGGVRGRDRGARPAQGLGKGRPSDVARVAVANGLGAGNEIDVLPIHAGVLECGVASRNAILDEVLSPFAPGMHAHTQYCYVFAHCLSPRKKNFIRPRAASTSTWCARCRPGRRCVRPRVPPACPP